MDLPVSGRRYHSIIETEVVGYSFVNLKGNKRKNGSSQCCGMHRSLAWAFPTPGGELFFNNGRYVAMHIMTTVKESHVSCINPQVVW